MYLECEGFQACKSIGGKADGCWNGIVAYDSTREGWMARAYSGCTISNYKATTNFVCGHPDTELNGCKFTTDRGIECDFYGSFHLDVQEDGYWALQAPPIMKSSDYNYIVSYGGFTEKNLEWGSVSISIDEINDNANSGQRRVIPDKGFQTLWPQVAPEPLDSQRQDYKTSHSENGSRYSETALPIDDETEIVSPTNKFNWPLSLDPRTKRSSTVNSSDTPSHKSADELVHPPAAQEVQNEENELLNYFNDEPPDYDEEKVFSEIAARPPETISRVGPVTDSSIPNTEDVMRMPGVYAPQDFNFAKEALDRKRTGKFVSKLLPSLGGSRASALTGGTLKKKLADTRKKYMTAAELAEAARIHRQLGKTAAEDFVVNLHLEDRVPNE